MSCLKLPMILMVFQPRPNIVIIVLLNSTRSRAISSSACLCSIIRSISALSIEIIHLNLFILASPFAPTKNAPTMSFLERAINLYNYIFDRIKFEGKSAKEEANFSTFLLNRFIILNRYNLLAIDFRRANWL